MNEKLRLGVIEGKRVRAESAVRLTPARAAKRLTG